VLEGSKQRSSQIRILIADDHEIVREGIRTLLAHSGRGWIICGEAANGQEAVQLAGELRPDIAILDVTMPGMSGLEAAKELSESGNPCRLLMFTMHESQHLGDEARQAGAQGFVVKSQAARDLIRAIDFILGGKTFFGAPPDDETDGEAGTSEKNPRPPRGFFRISLAFS